MSSLIGYFILATLYIERSKIIRPSIGNLALGGTILGEPNILVKHIQLAVTIVLLLVSGNGF